MTIEECANKVIDICLGSLTASGDLADSERAAANVIAALQALVLTETKRGAAECWQLGDWYKKDGNLGIASGCYVCHDHILATSPGINKELLHVKQRSHNLYTSMRALQAGLDASSQDKAGG